MKHHARKRLWTPHKRLCTRGMFQQSLVTSGVQPAQTDRGLDDGLSVALSSVYRSG